MLDIGGGVFSRVYIPLFTWFFIHLSSSVAVCTHSKVLATRNKNENNNKLIRSHEKKVISEMEKRYASKCVAWLCHMLPKNYSVCVVMETSHTHLFIHAYIKQFEHLITNFIRTSSDGKSTCVAHAYIWISIKFNGKFDFFFSVENLLFLSLPWCISFRSFDLVGAIAICWM